MPWLKLLALCPFVACAETWVSLDERVLEGQFVKLVVQEVTIQRDRDRKVFDIPLQQLDEASRQQVRAIQKAQIREQLAPILFFANQRLEVSGSPRTRDLTRLESFLASSPLFKPSSSQWLTSGEHTTSTYRCEFLGRKWYVIARPTGCSSGNTTGWEFCSELEEEELEDGGKTLWREWSQVIALAYGDEAAEFPARFADSTGGRCVMSPTSRRRELRLACAFNPRNTGKNYLLLDIQCHATDDH